MPRPGTTTDRGYGWQHQKLRKRWEPYVLAGEVLCARCNQPIDPDDEWDLGHTDDRTAYTGPEHARQCNRSAGGVKAHRDDVKKPRSRQW